MKRLITVILILALLLPAIALAELTRPSANIPDISNLSEIELKALLHEIQYRLFSEQLVNGVTVPVGTYKVGEDIPAGTYRIETSAENGIIVIYSSEGKPTESHLIGNTWSVNVIGKIVLEEGQTIAIDNCNITIYAYSGLF